MLPLFSIITPWLESAESIGRSLAGNVIVTALPAIPTEGLTMEDMPQLMEDVRGKMMAVFKETSAEVRAHSVPLVGPHNPGMHRQILVLL